MSRKNRPTLIGAVAKKTRKGRVLALKDTSGARVDFCAYSIVLYEIGMELYGAMKKMKGVDAGLMARARVIFEEDGDGRVRVMRKSRKGRVRAAGDANAG